MRDLESIHAAALTGDGDSTALRERWSARLLAGVENAQVNDIVGMIALDGRPTPVVAPGAAFRSVRQLVAGEEAVQGRLAQAGAVAFFPLEQDGYTVGQAYDHLQNGRIKEIVRLGYAPIKGVDENGDAELAIFQTISPQYPQGTRSGFLGLHHEGTPVPLIARVNDVPYVVEAKGSGNGMGAFMAFGERPLETIIMGGLPYKDALKEHEFLGRAAEAGQTPIIPLAVGKLVVDAAFAEQYGELGIVLKLTPSTVRLSHHDTSGSIPIESERDTLVVVRALLDSFLGKFFQPDGAPVFVSPASHLENYLVSDGMRITETDFEDFREFGGSDIPFVHTQTAQFIDAKRIVRSYFYNFGCLDRFDEPAMVPVIAQYVETFLAGKQVYVDLSAADSMESIADELWNQWLVDLDFAARKQQGYAPVAVARFMIDNKARVDTLVPDLATSLQRDEFMELLSGRVAHIDTDLSQHHSLYLAVAMASELTNRERPRLLERAYKAQRELCAKLLQNETMSDDEAELVAQYMQESKESYEFYFRVFASIMFFHEYIDSELDYLKRLKARGHDGLDMVIQSLCDMRKHTAHINESQDYTAATAFFNNNLLEYMQVLAGKTATLYN